LVDSALQIVPHINGINSVRIISILADTDFRLTCRAIRHLLYYGCLFLLDIFSFSAIYAPTAQFSTTIAQDEAMQLECARYVNTRFAPHPTIGPRAPLPPVPAAGTSGSGSSSGAGPLVGSLTDPAASISRDESRFDAEEIWPLLGDPENATNGTQIPHTPETPGHIPHAGHIPSVVDGVGIVELYASLKQGQSVKQWYSQHSRELANIDIRRFITFGVIKGFLYRVHKYACATGQPAPAPRSSSILPARDLTGPHSRTTTGTNTPYTTSSVGEEAPIPSVARRETSRERAPSFQSGSRSGIRGSVPSGFFEEDEDEIDDRTLSKYLDGTHCLDQICTELEISERELTARLKRYPGEVLIVHR
jgi:hypothetical protein